MREDTALKEEQDLECDGDIAAASQPPSDWTHPEIVDSLEPTSCSQARTHERRPISILTLDSGEQYALRAVNYTTTSSIHNQYDRPHISIADMQEDEASFLGLRPEPKYSDDDGLESDRSVVDLVSSEEEEEEGVETSDGESLTTENWVWFII